MNRWLIVSLSLWAVSWLASQKEFLILFFFCAFILFYFSYRFSSRRYALFFVIVSSIAVCMNRPAPAPESGIYSVYEIRQNYCLAKNGRHRILLYENEDVSYHDRYQVDTFEDISSLKNLSLFSFEEYMEKKNVQHAAAGPVKISSSNSIKAALFRKVKEKNDPFLLSVLYQIHENETLLSRLGIVQIVLFSWIEQAVRKRKGNSWSKPCVLFLVLLYSCFFPFHNACIRYVLVQFARWIRPKWQLSLCVQMVLYPLFVAGGAADLVLVIPILFTWISQKGWTKKEERIVRMLLLILLQIVFFSRVDVLNLFLFSYAKKAYAVLFLLKLAGFSFPALESLATGDQFVINAYATLPFQLLLIASLLYVLLGMKPEKTVKLCASSLLILFLSIRFDPFFHVYMLDIGQGDCTLLVEPFQKSAVLIDAGQNLRRDNVEQIIVPFLRSRNIRELDVLLLTHDDFDHSGGADALCEQIPVKKVVRDRTDNVDVGYPFYSLAPEREAKDENDESIVSFFSYDGLNYLWTGDAGIEVEKQLLEQYDLSDVDVLKLGHHGSNTSSSFRFLMETDPRLALISVGKNNRYKHPHKDVLRSLDELGIDALMTKDEGMIHIFTCRSLWLFETASGKIGFLDS